MEKRVVKTYTEVEIKGTDFAKSYRNPLTKIFQYEYALFEAVSKKFAHVEVKSMSIENLKMYFKELPLKSKEEGESSTDVNQEQEKQPKKMSQEKMLKDMESLVSRHLSGKIHFPMMDKCAAEVSTVSAEDNTHWLIFTDGVYGFALHLIVKGKGKLTDIEVKDFSQEGSDTSDAHVRKR